MFHDVNLDLVWVGTIGRFGHVWYRYETKQWYVCYDWEMKGKDGIVVVDDPDVIAWMQHCYGMYIAESCDTCIL